MSRAKPVATIGYEAATVRTFLDTLVAHEVALVVDVRAVASSRKPGFAKTALSANLSGAGIDYLHLRDLGTPAEGRAAARAGRHAEMKAIYARHLATAAAQDDLFALVEIVRSGAHACLLCLEADPTHCHRSLVAAALAKRIPIRVTHLMPHHES